MKKINTCHAFTFEGKFLVFLMRIIAIAIRFFYGKKFDTPLQNYLEDARYFKFPSRDLFYFLYKYYYQPPTIDDTLGATKAHFALQNFKELKPLGFEEKANTTLTVAGDLMPYEWIKKEFCQQLWDDIGDDFFSADIVFANLETPINASKPASYVPEMMLNDMYFNGSAEMFDIFNGNKKYKGFDVLSTANNHSLDMGEEGLLANIAFLKEKNIPYIGTAFSEKDRDDFPIIEKNGVKIAFLAYTYSMNKMLNPEGKAYLCNHIELNRPDVDLQLIKNQVLIAKSNGADLVVASMHYGNAYQTFPSKHIVKNTYRFFDECGVDIVLGGHAHNIQPMENYDFICPISQEKKKGFVVYALGDFIAYDIFTWGHLPVYLKMTISKGIFKGKEKTILSRVEAKPVYVCGVYQNRKKRELRLLDAEKLVQNIDNQYDMPDFNKAEFSYLMDFYNNFFNNNNTL
jgi:poly-gamma-glutamate capsule biosynthesis protein CapA/YwtB (metallophosphatase superfamily)